MITASGFLVASMCMLYYGRAVVGLGCGGGVMEVCNLLLPATAPSGYGLSPTHNNTSHRGSIAALRLTSTAQTIPALALQGPSAPAR